MISEHFLKDSFFIVLNALIVENVLVMILILGIADVEPVRY